jgi:hypothetical protein
MDSIKAAIPDDPEVRIFLGDTSCDLQEAGTEFFARKLVIGLLCAGLATFNASIVELAIHVASRSTVEHAVVREVYYTWTALGRKPAKMLVAALTALLDNCVIDRCSLEALRPVVRHHPRDLRILDEVAGTDD